MKGGGKMTEVEKAVKEFAEGLKKYYKSLRGNTHSGMIVYYIDLKLKEFLEGYNG